MIKKMLMASFMGAMLFLSGCSNTDGEDRLKVQQMLDDKDYAGVISALETQSDLNATSIEENMQLGYSYMAAVGLSYGDLITMMAGTTATTTPAPSLISTRAVGNSAFAEFAEKLQANAAGNDKVLEYLDKAIKMFAKVAKEAPNNTTDADLMLGMSQLAKATTAFSYLGDIKKLLEDGIDNDLVASSCAIVHIYAYPNVDSVANPTKDCVESAIVPNNPDTNASLYKEVKVTLTNGSEYRRLITADQTNVVVTDGYVDANADGNKTTDSDNGNNTAKPVKDETLTVQAALVTTLNESFNVIISIVPDQQTKDDIGGFRDEIDTDNNGLISAKEISDYIEANI